MSWLIALIISLAVVEPIVLIWTIVHFGWRPFQDAFPAQPQRDDAVVRRFQSFRLGVLNLGFSIHVAVDEQHLHLQPVAVFRWFGAHRASIPWVSISVIKRSRSGRRITVKIGERTLVGPAWCLELAEPAQSSPEAGDSSDDAASAAQIDGGPGQTG